MSETAESEDIKCTLESVVARTIATASSLPSLEVAFAILSTKDRNHYTFPAEEERLQSGRACDKKTMQFRLGRAAARLALTDVGNEKPAPILRGKAGEPLWPHAFTGSITHCDPWTVAVVARSSSNLAIGIDLENVRRVQAIDISSLICCDDELKWVRGGCDFYGRLAMVFSAKEALYKAVYPFCGRYLDFKEVELSPFSEDGFCKAQFLTCLAKDLGTQSWMIHTRLQGDFVFSCVITEVTES